MANLPTLLLALLSLGLPPQSQVPFIRDCYSDGWTESVARLHKHRKNRARVGRDCLWASSFLRAYLSDESSRFRGVREVECLVTSGNVSKGDDGHHCSYTASALVVLSACRHWTALVTCRAPLVSYSQK